MTAEHQIASSLEQQHLMVTARGTSALWLILNVLNPVKKGVLVPANVCEVVIAGIYYAGLEPIYVDVDPIIGNFNLGHITQSRTEDAGVLIAVHNFGSPLQMRTISEWAISNNIYVIEDVCNALGAVAQGRLAGTWGDAAIYSFGAAKIVNIGYGGALAVRDPNLLKRCRRLEDKLNRWGERQKNRDIAFQACLRVLRQYDELKDPVLYRAVYNRYKPALVACKENGTAIRIAEAIRHLPHNWETRRKHAEFYRKKLIHPAITHPPAQIGEVCWRYICHLPSNLRDAAVRYLRHRGLPVSTWYPAVDRLFGERSPHETLPGADQFERTVVNLWVEPEATEQMVRLTAKSLIAFLSSEE